jgi:hypothetical protein
MSGTAPYCTQAFSPLPGRRLRLISGGEGGSPTPCPEPPMWLGPFHTPNGRRYRVEACESHRPQVTTAPRLSRELPGRLQIQTMPSVLADPVD